MSQTYNETIELSSLSCLLKNGSLYPVIEDTLHKSTYGHPAFGIIFQSIKELYSNDILPDPITVYVDLEKKGLIDGINIPSNNLKGKEAIKFIANMDVNPDNIESYANQIQQTYGTRKLLSIFEDNKQLLLEGKAIIDVLARLDLDTGKIATMIGAQSRNMKNISDVAVEAGKNLLSAVEGKHLYISTGLAAWDDYTNGLFPERVYVVSARSNDGKSTVVQNILYNICVERNIRGCLITLESNATDVYNKLVQRITGISSLRIEKGQLTEKELEQYEKAAEILKGSQIVFDDSPELILPILRTKIRKAVSEGARFIIIDQLEQILLGGGGDNQSESTKLNFISYRIKAFAREMKVPIILVHQMNRASESGQNRGKDVDPILSDLAQAGEKAADAVLMIKHKKNGQIIVESYFHWTKNRQGQKGKRKVDFNGAKVLFSDIAGTTEFPPDLVQGELPNQNKDDDE